jgi:pimeloyl-ACP methyl ester carboxylesterase
MSKAPIIATAIIAIIASWQAHSGPTPTQLVQPQTPRKPYPYREVEIDLERREANVRLAGTLTLPSASGRHPAIVLVAGSGPDDRDATSYRGHKPFLVLADYLTRRGLAVLRLDDRSVGESRGPQATAQEIAEDIEFAVRELRRRDDIRADLVGVIGHSEGANVAAMVAKRDQGIAFVVLLAAAGSTGAELTLQQARASLPPIERWTQLQHKQINRQALLVAAAAEPVSDLEARRRVEEVWSRVLKEEGRPELPLPRALADSVSPPYRFFLRYDPLPALKELGCPVLVILGDKDLRTPIESNAPRIREALSSNPRAKIVELQGLNHLMQPAVVGSVEEGQRNSVTISPAVLTVLGGWLQEVTRGEHEVSTRPE